MKRFDEAAAKRGATVCTRGGGDAIIIRFDLDRVDNKNILAVFCMRGRFDEQKTRIGVFPSNGQFCDDMEGLNDLMMADDDYLEKLERGEYNHSGEATEKVDWSFLTSAFINMARAADDMSNRIKQLLEESKRAQDIIEERKKEKR